MDNTQKTLSPNGNLDNLSAKSRVIKDTTFDASKGVWLLPIGTGQSHGKLEFTIVSNISYPSIDGKNSSIYDTKGQLLINWLAEQPLESVSSVPSMTRVNVKYITDKSTGWNSILSSQTESVLISSPDEYRSYYKITPSFPTSITGNSSSRAVFY